MGTIKQPPNTLHHEKKQKVDRNDDEKSGSDSQTEVSVVGMMKVYQSLTVLVIFRPAMENLDLSEYMNLPKSVEGMEGWEEREEKVGE